MSQPTATLIGTTWTLTSLSLGGKSITPGRLLVRPTLRLSGSTVTGSTGCSPLKARVRLRGQATLFHGIDAGSSDRCPDHALSLREDFILLLSLSTRSELQGDVLILHAPAGALIFSRTVVDPAGRPER